jgi:hypothetical protein
MLNVYIYTEGNTEGVIKNGQSIDIGNNGHKPQNKDKHNKIENNTTQHNK